MCIFVPAAAANRRREVGARLHLACPATRHPGRARMRGKVLDEHEEGRSEHEDEYEGEIADECECECEDEYRQQ